MQNILNGKKNKKKEFDIVKKIKELQIDLEQVV